jgi:hypothetical protein
MIESLGLNDRGLSTRATQWMLSWLSRQIKDFCRVAMRTRAKVLRLVKTELLEKQHNIQAITKMSAATLQYLSPLLLLQLTDQPQF